MGDPTSPVGAPPSPVGAPTSPFGAPTSPVVVPTSPPVGVPTLPAGVPTLPVNSGFNCGLDLRRLLVQKILGEKILLQSKSHVVRMARYGGTQAQMHNDRNQVVSGQLSLWTPETRTWALIPLLAA